MSSSNQGPTQMSARTHAQAAGLLRRPFAPGAIGFRAMMKVPLNGDPFGCVTDGRRATRESEDIAEQRKATAARRARDRALSMSERLERVHQLCAQLARLQPVRPKQR